MLAIDLFERCICRPAKDRGLSFTTLHPNLGVVGVDGKEFVMRYLGVNEGAHRGAGLAIGFGHVERCRVLLHLVDATAKIRRGLVLRRELLEYGGGLSEKPEIVGLTGWTRPPRIMLRM